MANKIDIIINMLKQGHGDEQAVSGLKKLSQGFESMTGMSLSAAGAMGLAAKAIQFVGQAIKETMDYALDVGDMALALGTTAEEASKLIQIGDDLRISQETMASGFRFALNSGIVPSIDGLAKLSDEMMAMEDPAARMQFAIDKFGRAAGGEMLRVLEKGGDAIREMGEELEGSALVMSDDAVQAAKDYYASLDKLDEVVLGLKYSIGTELIPEVTKLTDGLGVASEYFSIYDAIKVGLQSLVNPVLGVKGSVDMLTNSMEESVVSVEAVYEEEGKLLDRQPEITSAMMESAKASQEAAAAQEDYSDSLDEFMVAVNGKVGPAIEEFTTTTRDLKAEMSEVNSKIQYFESLGDGLTDDQQAELGELIGRYDELELELKEVETAHKTMMANIILDMIMRRAEMDGVISDTENAIITSFAVTSGVWDEGTATLYGSVTELMGNAKLSAEEAARLVDYLYGRVTGVAGSYDINFRINVFGDVPNVGEGSGASSYSSTAGGLVSPTGDYAMAGGGTFTVPPGYPNDSYAAQMHLTSGEVVTVTPNTTNNYNLTINDAGSRGNVITDFSLLKSLAAV
jgi:hypothetical protein